MYKMAYQAVLKRGKMLDIIQTIFKYKEKKSPDQLGYFPEKVHTNAMPERRYLWTSRLLVIISCMSICLSMMLASAIYVLLPQRGAYPRLLQTNTYFSQLEQTEMQEKNVPVQDLIAEQYIEEYILLRHVISNDYDELMYRWAPGSELYWLSSRAVFQNFVTNDVQNNIRQFRMRDMVRMVEVEWVKPMTRGLWQAQFITMDYYGGEQVPIVNIWRAYMRVVFTNINFNNKDQRVFNPYGFLVLNYSLSYVGTPDEPESYLATAKDARNQIYAY